MQTVLKIAHINRSRDQRKDAVAKLEKLFIQNHTRREREKITKQSKLRN